MNVVRAATYAVRHPLKHRSLAKVWLFAPIPIFGVLWGNGYAMLVLRRMLKGHPDSDLPEAELDWRLLLRGLTATVLWHLTTLIVMLLCAPLYLVPEVHTVSADAPSLIQALAGPSDLLVTLIAVVISTVVLTRYALTDSFLAALNPYELWAHLRAEPAIWITAATIGFVVTNLPGALLWALPLSAAAKATIWNFAIPVWSIYGLLLSVHLSAQAFAWSRRTAAKRAASMGYRW